MNFSEALDELKNGAYISRTGWNSKGTFIFIERNVSAEGALPFIVMNTCDNKLIPWVASQTDLLADDWGIY